MSFEPLSFEIDVTRRLGDVQIGTVFAVDGGLTVLFGPSGIGKTSVLNMIAGLLRPDWGYVRVSGKTLFDAAAGIDLPPEARRAGYVFQEARLFPHKRVRANLLYGCHPGARLGFGDTVEFLGIGHLLERWPRSLSGGEARRVAIGRALLSGARFLLLDEPLSSLDRARREEIMRAILHIRDHVRLPILMVTHDPEEAERLGTRIVRM
ncbi:ATP-binding cassette domain-containing protein [Hephaestia sp. GCM10023244]|uniref:ATP-binding cassette domain-containing protein n=1 Tax=unclassified Hephaestia TaxID=2631281 RepID=UPI002076DD3E|nr:ATP-binding cassette domain-containing protein [Hephaestia sp. MAHUQ-44]MCM8730944.1 ATP-binding cassette domain-containing protein [Hephaestia sp. MAHUQ-44]